ncbi:MAG: hypothetical protein ACNS60_18085 [Candidatus Cyclobacteriaceae bacterium M2_1C_046]
MKANYLFPHRFKKFGWILFLIGLALGIAHMGLNFTPDFFNYDFTAEYSDDNLTDEIAAAGIILGLMLVGFSKVKIEDEFSLMLRHDSLMWSIYIYYALLIISIVFIHGLGFLDVMVYSLFAPLLIFVIRFHFYLWRNEKLS